MHLLACVAPDYSVLMLRILIYTRHSVYPMAVVDQYGNLRGVENLRVIDASIMPDLVRAAINPTVLMMAERLSDVIVDLG